jgi:hypothetical protein
VDGLLGAAKTLWNAGSSLKKAEKPKEATGINPVDQLSMRKKYQDYATQAMQDGQQVPPYAEWVKQQQGLLAR